MPWAVEREVVELEDVRPARKAVRREDAAKDARPKRRVDAGSVCVEQRGWHVERAKLGVVDPIQAVVPGDGVRNRVPAHPEIDPGRSGRERGADHLLLRCAGAFFQELRTRARRIVNHGELQVVVVVDAVPEARLLEVGHQRRQVYYGRIQDRDLIRRVDAHAQGVVLGVRRP